MPDETVRDETEEAGPSIHIRKEGEPAPVPSKARVTNRLIAIAQTAQRIQERLERGGDGAGRTDTPEIQERLRARLAEFRAELDELPVATAETIAAVQMLTADPHGEV